jgi:predicted SnoaL-like aldol condensation-catalyzing enzyme
LLGGRRRHAEAVPDFSVERRRVIAEGDLVAIHAFVQFPAEDRGTAAVDLLRMADGRVVEHWDVMQPVPEQSANANTMF